MGMCDDCEIPLVRKDMVFVDGEEYCRECGKKRGGKPDYDEDGNETVDEGPLGP